jgi:hypothetical protein
MSDEHVQEYFNDMREGLRKAEVQLNEEISAQTRIKLSRAAKRTSNRRKITRNIRSKRRKNLRQLKVRAKNQIKDHLRKRVHKGNWKELSFAQRAAIDKRLSVKPVKKLIDTMTKRIMPTVVQGESERMKHLHDSFNPIVGALIENYITEARKAEKPKRQPLTGEKKLKRKGDNRNNQRNKRGRDKNAIASGNIRGKVLGVRDKDGNYKIISKRSFNPERHREIVDPEQASRSSLENFLNKDDFVNTETSERLFGFKDKRRSGGGRKKSAKKDEPKEKKSKSKDEQKSASKPSSAGTPEEPGEWDLEQGSIIPVKKQSKNDEMPTSHPATIVEPAMAVFANAMNGIGFEEQVKRGLIDKATMMGVIKSPHQSLHSSAQRMAQYLVSRYGPNACFENTGSSMEGVELSDGAKKGGITNKTAKTDIRVKDCKTGETIDTCSVKCSESQAASGNYQDTTVALGWSVDNAEQFGITLTPEARKQVEEITKFMSDPNEYAGTYLTIGGPSGLYTERGKLRGQDPGVTKKEQANKKLTKMLDKLFAESPELKALYTLAQMTGLHKFKENNDAIANTLIAVSHDGSSVKIAPIDMNLARTLAPEVEIKSRIKSGPQGTALQEEEYRRTGVDRRHYAIRNTVRVIVGVIDLNEIRSPIQESKTTIAEMNGYQILNILLEKKKDITSRKDFYVGTSPDEIKENLEIMKNLAEENPMELLKILMPLFEFEDLSPVHDWLDVLPNEGYTVNRVYVNGNEYQVPVIAPVNYPVPGMEVPQLGEERDYRKEYDNYHSRPEQRKNRSKRVLARRLMIKLGKVHKGDGKDVDHKDGNPKNNGKSNLRVRDKSENRADNG